MKASRTFPGSGLAMPSAARAVQRILGLAPPLEHERAAVIIRDAILAIGVLGIALFTRFWMLGGTGFSGDEAVYSGQAAVIAGDSEMARYFVLISRGNSNFLMFQYLVAGAYHLFGITDAVPRMVSAVFSTLTVPIAYELGRTLFNRRVAIGSAILLAASSYTIALGRLALLDAALGFFFALSMLFAAKWIRSQHSQNLWLYAFAAAAALAIQVKVTGVLVVVIAALYLVASGQIRKIRLRQWVGGGAVFVLFMAPALIEFAIDPHQFLALLGDSTRLRQLFLNLITNAIKYTPRGGHVEMTLSLRNNDEVGFTVRDTGVGIAAADLPHVFDRFWRADRARSRRVMGDGNTTIPGGGFGLGLAIAQWIAQAHGGTLTAQSRLGRGSIFTVLFPVSMADSGAKVFIVS